MQLLFEANERGDFDAAEALRTDFIPHEDLRNAWSPAKVLHYATELAGIAKVGPVPPYLSPLSAEQMDTLAPVARALVAALRRGAHALTRSSPHNLKG